MNTKLELKNICVKINGNQILRDISLLVGKGEYLSLLGPSGCGKSTLLKTIAGITQIRSGEVWLDGQEITALPAHKRGAVIVFQDLRLFPHMSVIENIAFPLKMRGVNKNERLREASVYLQMVKLAGCENRRVSEISGGQQQRVALARALAARPHLLLLDEPFSSLDENLRDEMRELILTLHKSMGMTTIMVTHDRSEALAMSDRLALMFDGALHQTGTPDEVCKKPAGEKVSAYLDSYVF